MNNVAPQPVEQKLGGQRVAAAPKRLGNEWVKQAAAKRGLHGLRGCYRCDRRCLEGCWKEYPLPVANSAYYEGSRPSASSRSHWSISGQSIAQVPKSAMCR